MSDEELKNVLPSRLLFFPRDNLDLGRKKRDITLLDLGKLSGNLIPATFKNIYIYFGHFY